MKTDRWWSAHLYLAAQTELNSGRRMISLDSTIISKAEDAQPIAASGSPLRRRSGL